MVRTDGYNIRQSVKRFSVLLKQDTSRLVMSTPNTVASVSLDSATVVRARLRFTRRRTAALLLLFRNWNALAQFVWTARLHLQTSTFRSLGAPGVQLSPDAPR